MDFSDNDNEETLLAEEQGLDAEEPKDSNAAPSLVYSSGKP